MMPTLDSEEEWPVRWNRKEKATLALIVVVLLAAAAIGAAAVLLSHTVPAVPRRAVLTSPCAQLVPTPDRAETSGGYIVLDCSEDPGAPALIVDEPGTTIPTFSLEGTGYTALSILPGDAIPDGAAPTTCDLPGAVPLSSGSPVAFDGSIVTWDYCLRYAEGTTGLRSFTIAWNG